MSTYHPTEQKTPERALTPSGCPACQSPKVTSKSKVVSSETYWRCLSCGEVWNVGRRAAAHPGGSFYR